MKLDMSKWKALSIKNRLKKGFRLTQRHEALHELLSVIQLLTH